jgi:hypothetical protein
MYYLLPIVVAKAHVTDFSGIFLLEVSLVTPTFLKPKHHDHMLPGMSECLYSSLYLT